MSRISNGTARLLGLWGLIGLVACIGQTGSGSTEGASRVRSDTITREEIARGNWPNAYALVEELRPRWLRTHGADRISGEGLPIQVHLGDVRAGGVAALRDISVRDIESLRWIDPVSAAGRWGLDYGNGAIVVTLRSR
jgi:hypothetical protein